MINYIDSYGRYHIKPVTEADPLPTNNAYIYSFYASMVGLPVNFVESLYTGQLYDLSEKVITRHPNKEDNHVAISHDEYVGLAGLYFDECRTLPHRICSYGERNYRQFCDQPGFVPTPFRKLVIDDVLSSYEDLANDPEQNVRRAVIRYPKLWPIAFWHRPEHQYFYLRCAGRSPGIARTLYFIGASISTVVSGGSTMLGFKLLRLQKERNLAERFVSMLFNKFCDFKALCREEFPAGHPILEGVEKL